MRRGLRPDAIPLKKASIMILLEPAALTTSGRPALEPSELEVLMLDKARPMTMWVALVARHNERPLSRPISSSQAEGEGSQAS